MARRSRQSKRSQWESMRQDMTKQFSTARGVEGRETIPEKACGKCKDFSENTMASDGRGYCRVLKNGSDILADSPLYVMEGDAGLMCMFNMDAAKCKHYVLMDIIDTDGTECSDPQYRRAQRQMEKLGR